MILLCGISVECLSGLEPEVPLVEAILFAGQKGDLVEGDWAKGGGGVPGFAQGGANRGDRDVEVDQEVGMRAVDSIVWLAGGQGKDLLDEAEVEVQKEGAVEQQEAVAAALGVISGESPACTYL